MLFYFYLTLIRSPVLDSNIRVDFNRNTGSRDTDDWAVGFTGGLYEASILSSEPFTVGWTFDGKTVEYNVDMSALMVKEGEVVKQNRLSYCWVINSLLVLSGLV